MRYNQIVKVLGENTLYVSVPNQLAKAMNLTEGESLEVTISRPTFEIFRTLADIQANKEQVKLVFHDNKKSLMGKILSLSRNWVSIENSRKIYFIELNLVKQAKEVIN